MKCGDVIATRYGLGRVELYREVDRVYVLQLPYGRLYATKAIILNHCNRNSNQNHHGRGNGQNFRHVHGHVHVHGSKSTRRLMELNVAYEALETMRKLNLEIACQERGISIPDASKNSNHSFWTEQCTRCWFEQHDRDVAEEREEQRKRQQRESRFSLFRGTGAGSLPWSSQRQPATTASAPTSKEDSSNDNSDGNDGAPQQPQAQEQTLKPCQSQQHHRRRRPRPHPRRRPATPCLICGAPTCQQHASAQFRTLGVTICLECQALFQMDWVLAILTEPDAKQRRRRWDQVLDAYDRAMLLLQYANHTVLPELIPVLQSAKTKSNHVGLGSSTAGILSGALGLAAAATLLTPAGPPLLLASLLLGGGASAVQTGTELHTRHWSQPHAMAHRLLALHGVACSTVRLVGIWRDAVALQFIRDYNNDDSIDNNNLTRQLEQMDLVQARANLQRSAVLAGSVTSSTAAVAILSTSAVAETTAIAGSFLTTELGLTGTAMAESGVVAGRNARFFTRTSSTLMAGAMVAQMAGGTLSALMLVLETRNLHSTVQAMRAGNPCDKAQALQVIADTLPRSNIINTNNSMMSSRVDHDDDDDDDDDLKVYMEFFHDNNDDNMAQDQQQQQQNEGGAPGGVVSRPQRLPTTAALNRECTMYLECLAQRQRALTEQEVTELLLWQQEAVRREQQQEQEQQPAAAAAAGANQATVTAANTATATNTAHHPAPVPFVSFPSTEPSDHSCADDEDGVFIQSSSSPPSKRILQPPSPPLPPPPPPPSISSPPISSRSSLLRRIDWFQKKQQQNQLQEKQSLGTATSNSSYSNADPPLA